MNSGLIENKDLSPKSVIVNMDDFTEAAKDLKPSISEEDIKYFNLLKNGNNPESKAENNQENLQNNQVNDTNAEECITLRGGGKDDKRKTVKRTRTAK